MKTTGALLVLAASLASAAPATSPATPLQGRQVKTLCDQYGYWSGSGYEVNNNAWGKGAASSGSQCTYIDNSGGNGLGWHAQWNWQGGQNNVKSYPYAGRQLAKGRTIQSINSLSTSVQWSYSSSNIRADVAYDLFTARDPNHDKSSGDYELMIWLAKYGDVQPIGSPVGNVNVGGRSWQLWSGMNGSMRVFSFVTTSGPITNWSGDVKQFYSYLTQSQGFPASQQNLLTFQFGTEPFTGGPATFQVSHFSANMS